MSDFLASEVSVEEEAPAVRQVPALATAIVGAGGVTLKGPTDQQVSVGSYDEWEGVFGGHIASSSSSLFVKSFFENGGVELHWFRVVHHADSTDPTTKTSAAATLMLLTASLAASHGLVVGSNTGPWALTPGDTIIVSVDGGGNLTATFTAVAAAVTSGSAATYALANNDTLLVKVDAQSVAQTVTFLTSQFVSIGAATAAEVAAVINATIVGGKATVSANHVVITSDKLGTGSHIQVTGGTGNGGKLAFSTAQVDGTGNVASIASVTYTEAAAVIGGAITGSTISNVGGAVQIASNTTGPSSSIQVIASSTADDEFGFDNATHTGSTGAAANTLRADGKYDGTYANNIIVLIQAATSGDAAYFNLLVQYNGTVIERFPNLSMTDTDPRYVETIVNADGTGSKWIKVTDQDVGLTAPNDRPANGTFGVMTGGNDGLASLADVDFVGGTGANGSVGLRCLDEVQTLTLVAMPARATATVHNGMIQYCEVTRDGLCFAILDPPTGQSADMIVSYVRDTAAIQNLSERCAIYWPNILVANPSPAIFGNATTLVAPPSGAIAGLYTRTDAKTPAGVFVHPAGTENGVLFNVLGLEMPEVKKIAKRKIVFPQLINPISTEGGPIFVDGARCLKSTGSWPTVGERRGIIFLEASLKLGLAFMRHRNINDRLYNEGKSTVRAFMILQTKNEAFASTKPSEAFSIDFGKGLNPPSVQFAHRVYARLSVATSKPAEFVVLKVTPDTTALDAELAAA